MGPDVQRWQVGIVTWRGINLPIRADFNRNGHAVSYPRVFIEDMPYDLRRSMERRATEHRRMFMPPSGCGYLIQDFEGFMMAEKDLAKRLQAAKVCCANCGLLFGECVPSFDGITGMLEPCPICGSEDGVFAVRHFGRLSLGVAAIVKGEKV